MWAPAVHADSLYCSCVRTLHSFLPEAPLINAIYYQNFPRTTPQVGAVALFSYGEGVMKQHVAYVASIDEFGMELWEGNKVDCTFTKRFMRWDVPNDYLVGFVKL